MIALQGVSKIFPGVAALSDVTFDIRSGACHALLGENGAGKSTLGKILAGLYRPDAGQISIDGTPVRFHAPLDAARAGVGIVHQELVFCPNLSVAENLCLADLPRRGLLLDRPELRRRARARLALVGLDVDVDLPLSSLSIAQEQLVQIAAAVGQGARILVFDEPTSSLGVSESERLFALIRQLKAKGTTIIYVSHRLEEIFELCDAVTVLRDGRHVATRAVADVTPDELVQLMVGRHVESLDAQATPTAEGPPRLRVTRLTSPGVFEDVSLEVRGGEIVGLAGLVGAGRTEVLEALYGLNPHVRGEVEVDGRPAHIATPQQAQGRGMALVPEDRKRHGLVLSMNVRENITLPLLDRFRGWLGLARRRGERRLADSYSRRFSIRAPGVETPVRGLSGGNQQKIVLAKALAAGGGVLLIDEPTRGVDVGAKQEIHDLIRDVVRDGAAVLLVSSELPELLALSHRIVVLRQGRVMGNLPRSQATPETVLRLMAGLA